jgi:type II secretory pathway component PulF
MNQAASRWSLPIVLVAAVLHLVFWLLLVRDVFMLPAYEKQFAEYNMKLPALTQLFFAFFKVVEPAPAVWFVLPVVDAIVLVVLHRQRQLLLLILWSVLVLILLAAALGALELGIHLALLKLQEGLSRSLPGQ